MQDSREKKQCLIFVRNNANDTADHIEAYAKKSGMKVVETIFNTDKKAVERLRYYIERDVIICVLVRDVVDISMELNEIKAVMTLAAEHGISINAESRGYEAKESFRHRNTDFTKQEKLSLPKKQGNGIIRM